jgi:hypothetical protein
MAVALDFQQFRGWKAFLQTRKTTSANTYFNSYNYVAKQAFPTRCPLPVYLGKERKVPL